MQNYIVNVHLKVIVVTTVVAISCGGTEDAGAALAKEFANTSEDGGQEDGDQDRLDELRA
jgi:hypothetical protein